MNNDNRTPHPCRWLTLLMLWAAAATAFAADQAVSAEDMQVAEAHAGRAQAQLQERFISEFSEFAGSAGNAQSLYSGLRSGTRITLTTPAANSSGRTGTAVLQFNPAGRPMSIGGAFISMALAKQQLARHGVTRPVPAQIQAALNGGAISIGNDRSQPVALKGVLAQREQGLGWSVIAKASGISLGRVLVGLRNPTTDMAAVSGGNVYAGTQTASRGSRHAAANDVPGTMRTSARVLAQGEGSIAQ